MDRVIHQYWDGPMPKGIAQCIESVKRLNTWCEYKLWTRETLPTMEMQPLIDRCSSAREASDVIRAELLWRHGGIWLDTDMQCLKSLEPLDRITEGRWNVQDESAWPLINSMVIISGVFGCIKEDPYARALMDGMIRVYNEENPHLEYTYVWPFDWLAVNPPLEWRRWILPKDTFHQSKNGYCFHWNGSALEDGWTI